MKLILKQYLSQMKERGELDAFLPELLSDMGFNVISKPQIGTRQYGVDISAIGKNDAGEEAVYLFSIKAGDLSRTDWDGDTNQALRPSLNEIIDVYIHSNIPNEHKDKPIIICLCFGGEIKEQIRQNVTMYIKQNTTNKISFQEWNGDKIAQLIEDNFLKEDFLPKDYQGLMRKSLALLDEPLTSYRYFKELVTAILLSEKLEITRIRQVYISLWILFVWCRDEDNLESSFLSAELAVLHCWDLIKYLESYPKSKRNKITDSINSLFQLYRLISRFYLENKIIPYCHIKHGLSSAINGRNHIDTNLRLFDILGRLSLNALWLSNDIFNSDSNDIKDYFIEIQNEYILAIKHLIINNKILLSPYHEKQTTEVALTLIALSQEQDLTFVHSWLKAMIDRIQNNFFTNQTYLSMLSNYSELIQHPKSGEKEYKQKVTASSVFYPFLATFASHMEMQDIYDDIKALYKREIPECNLQAWYLSDDSEQALWKNNAIHGATLTNLDLDMTMDEWLKEILYECKNNTHFKELSAIKYVSPCLLLVACRHYQYPVPYDFFVVSEDN